VKRFLWAWVGVTVLGCVVVHQATRVARAPLPDAAAQRWAMQTLAAVRTSAQVTVASASAERYRAAGPVIALAWWRGRVRARYVGGPQFAASVRRAAAYFAADETLRALPGFAPDAGNPVRFTVAVLEGSGPVFGTLPVLSTLGVVPLVEGVSAELGGRHAYLTPDELIAADLVDRLPTPIPDLSLGMDLAGVSRVLAQQLGVLDAALRRKGHVRRFRAFTILEHPYPASVPVDAAMLRRAARESAQFLLRHQRNDGSYTYLYDARTGQPDNRLQYNLPRHAGTTYFLAQAARLLDMPEARAGALRALGWVQRSVLTRCGGIDRLCLRDDDVADVGGAALTALAASELLRSGEAPLARNMLVGLLSFIRAMQRPDGELMHVYDLRAGRPLDIQQMYYSGEAADALLSSSRVVKDPQNLAVAARVMRHLTGSAWNFFGSRYFYGEEHWTCQAVAQAVQLRASAGAGDAGGERSADLNRGVDFCLGWLAFQRALLYAPGQTPWPVAGAIGVGPVIVPRLTTAASRVEAGALIYRVAKARGDDVRALREQLEAHLGLLLRMRWAPGPAHLLFDARAAYGGLPATQAGLEVRNDFVQHAGSAMLAWAEVLADERR
jgi:hypothetical protein